MSSGEVVTDAKVVQSTFWAGVILSMVADAIIAVSLNLQKTAHMRNQARATRKNSPRRARVARQPATLAHRGEGRARSRARRERADDGPQTMA